MSTATTTYSGQMAPAASKPGSKGFLRRCFEALAAGQQARAQRYVMASMAQLPDARLSALGYTAEQIDEIRAHRDRPVYWF